MTSPLDLIRPELCDFAGYASARREKVSGKVWLNANESPWPSSADDAGSLNRYPEPQPLLLRGRMAELYGVRADQLLITRGSDEGIDLLVRAFCRAGVDAVLTAPPCFGMYAVAAYIQNATLVEVPLREVADEWTFDIPAMIDAVSKRNVHLVFLCSPSNPTGQTLTLSQIRSLSEALKGRAMLVIDEAYVEFSSVGSASAALDDCPNLVVLRTLSKAHALAGARIGAVLAEPSVIAILRNISAPYPVPAPCAALALSALSEAGVIESARRCRASIEERQRILKQLAGVQGVKVAYPSEGNYLLVRFDDAQGAFGRLLAAGVVARDMRAMPQLQDALRISIGTVDENEQMLAAIRQKAIA